MKIVSKEKVFRISYFGPIKSIVHKSEELLTSCEISDPTVMDILRILSNAHGSKFEELVFHEGNINRAVNISVNGKCLTDKKAFEEKVGGNSEVEIVFISQAAGG